MTSSTEMILIGGIVKTLQDMGSWCGETHIQKTSYIAKHIERVPFESDFILYKHGPFSFDLNSSLNSMRSQKLLNVTPQQFGSTYSVDVDLWNVIDHASGDTFERFRAQIEEACRPLARKKVAELERIVTAVYVYINFYNGDVDIMAKKLVTLKPHISPREAYAAFQEAESFTSKITAVH